MVSSSRPPPRPVSPSAHPRLIRRAACCYCCSPNCAEPLTELLSARIRRRACIVAPRGSVQAQRRRGKFLSQSCLVGTEQASEREREPAAGLSRAQPGPTATQHSPARASSGVPRQHRARGQALPRQPAGHSPSAMAPSTRMPDSLTTHSGWKRSPLSRGSR